MKVMIDIPEDRYADIQRIASVQLARRYPTPEQIIAKGVTINEPQKWVPFHKRELTEEEKEMYPEWSYYLDCELPEDGDEILISSPTWGVYQDTFNNEGSDGCYLEGDEEIDDGMAWMPLPEPYGGDNE